MAAAAKFRTDGGTWPRVGGLLLITAGLVGMLLMPYCWPYLFCQPLPSKYCGHSIFFSATNFSSLLLSWSKLNPTISKPLTRRRRTRLQPAAIPLIAHPAGAVGVSANRGKLGVLRRGRYYCFDKGLAIARYRRSVLATR